MSFSLQKVKLNRSTWVSLILTVLLFGAVVLTQYASLTSRDQTSKAQSGSCNLVLSWPGNGSPFYEGHFVSGPTNPQNSFLINTTTYTIFNIPAGSYSYTIHGVNADSSHNGYSVGIGQIADCGSSCTPSAPSAPNLVSPANGASTTSTTMALDWDTPSSWGTDCVGGSNLYQVYLEKDDTTPDVLVSSPSASSHNASGLTVGTWYWRVRADNGDEVSAYSSTRSFSVTSAYSQSGYYSQSAYYSQSGYYSQSSYVSGSPDLAVTNFVLSPPSPNVGQTVTATINVKNNGDASASGTFWVDLYSNQAGSAPCLTPNGQATRSFSSLGIGVSTGNFTLSFTAPSSAGTYTARVFVDADCQIAESNDTNNQQTLGYTVAGSGGGTSGGGTSGGGSTSGGGGTTTTTKVTPSGGGTPKPTTTDVTLNFAANPLLKGGMEVTILVQGTNLSQKAVVEDKGGTLIFKTNSQLTKGTLYTMKVSSKNSLVQTITFNFGDNLTLPIAGFILGDTNSDNIVDQKDFDSLVTDGIGNQDLLFDLNYDGVVNSVDYSILLMNLGKKG